MRKPLVWKSAVAPLMRSFLEEKWALGYRYHTDEGTLNRIDRQLVDLSHTKKRIPRGTILKLCEALPHEQNSSRSRRMTVLNEFLRYMARQNCNVELIPPRHFPIYRRSFKARIFTIGEIQDFLAAADGFPQSRENPLLRYEIPLLFRFYTNMGLRLNEALLLRPDAVDLERGWIRIEKGKNYVSRLLPMSEEMIDRVRQYERMVQTRGIPEGYYFPGSRSPHLLSNRVRTYFLALLQKAQIPYRGPGVGPRIHDLRHTFAVQCLNKWIREKVDLMAALPVLSKYLGHKGLAGTQRYLQLTAELYPEIIKKLESTYAHLIPAQEGVK
ncbi:MAG: tyrosine-type recombinase/integrase [Planctomycetes bacterium]|nr:tyrosine-type recombinase/integrase [Planctomycetota bacterium]